MKHKNTGSNVFSSLRIRDYRYLWFATLSNVSGQWIQQITLGWLVWELSKSAMMVGITTGVRTIPYLLIGPVSGVIADRIDRRRILMIVEIAMATMAVLFAVIVAMDWVRVWHAILFSFVMGCGFTMCMPVMQALVANTVPREDLGNAIALSATAFNASRVVGPALGGILIVSFGAAGNFLLQAALFICVVAAIVPMETPFRDTAFAAQASVLKSLFEGFRYIWSEKPLFSLIILSFIPSFCVIPVTHILPAFTGRVLHAEANVYGYLMASFGVGGVLATLFMASSSTRLRGGWLGIISLCSATAIVVLLSQARSPWIACLLFAAVGFSMLTFRVNNNTLVQMLSPDSLRGRITSIYQIDHAFTPLASLILGTIADLVSVPAALATTGIVGLLSVILFFSFFRPIREVCKNLHI